MHTDNKFLTLLSASDLALFQANLRVVKLQQGRVLAEPHQDIKNIYFPHSGIVSYVVGMSDGNMIETAMVGLDGVVGAVQALDEKVSPNKIVVQVPGHAAVVDVDIMRKAIDASPSLRVMLAKHEQYFIAQVQQSVGCAASHTVEPRMCGWLMRMHDLVGPDLPLTHEIMAQMIGVRRTSVSLAAGRLQDRGLIRYRRGRIYLADLEKLGDAACECHQALNTHYRKLFQSFPPTHSNFHQKANDAAYSHQAPQRQQAIRSPQEGQVYEVSGQRRPLAGS